MTNASTPISRETKAENGPQAEAEAELARLSPEDQDLVRRVRENHPLLTLAEALAMLKFHGGL